MRKYLYAGAVAGGFLLLGAVPAHADVQPAPAGALSGVLNSSGGLDPAGGLRITDPIGGTRPLLDVKPGDNSADVPGATGDPLPLPDGAQHARTGMGGAGDRTAPRPARPAQRTATEDLPAAGGGLPVSSLPIANLLGGLPSVSGLLPNGDSADQESGLLGGDLPLLGALVPHSLSPSAPAASGLPAGGTDVSGPQQPATAKPAEDPAVANDARLHEEPTDPEDKGHGRRAFSNGRPVAGVDPDYK